jgi:ParB-like chromosome segregation protein Spo0J
VPATWLATRDIPIADLTRYPGNARRGDTGEIRKSIRRHGQYRAIVVRDTGGALVILAGNHTRDALEAEGRDTARCEVITCTDDEARRINLADNRLAELPGPDGTRYDDSELVQLLSCLDEDYEGTGWAAEDVQALLETPEPLGGGC